MKGREWECEETRRWEDRGVSFADNLYQRGRPDRDASHLFLVGKSCLEQTQEQPLSPLVVVRVTRGKLSLPLKAAP